MGNQQNRTKLCSAGATVGRHANVLCNAVSRLALSVAAGMVGLPVLSATAQMACLPTGPTTVYCSGTHATPQAVGVYGGQTSQTASTAPGFSVDTTAIAGSTAMTMTDEGALSYIDTNASSLTGSRTGLLMYSEGPNGIGSITVQTNGLISGGISGISAVLLNEGAGMVPTAGGISITASGGVSGGISAATSQNVNGGIEIVATSASGANGISATHRGGGAINITATDLIRGNVAAGIFAQNLGPAAGPAPATNLIVNAAAVIGEGTGIRVLNNGSGVTNVTASGAVQGVFGDGVVAENGFDAAGLRVEAASVTGGETGISLTSRSRRGGIELMASGHVLGMSGDGINLFSSTDVTRLSVKAATVEGAQNGIIVAGTNPAPSFHFNGSFIEITTSGLVKGGTGDGIHADNALVTGAGGGVSIDAAEVSGGRNGIVARTNGLIIGDGSLVNGALTITARGAVTGLDGNGIHAEHRGTAAMAINAQSTVTGSVTGIYALHAGAGSMRIDTQSTVRGGVAGIYAQHTGTGSTTIDATGPVEGGVYGVRAEHSQTESRDLAVNVAAVTGGTGVSLFSESRRGAISVTATGPVLGTVGDGINSYNRFDLRSISVTATSVEGARNGIVVLNESVVPSSHLNGGFITISTSGLVKGVAGDGIHANNQSTSGAGGGMSIDVAEVSGGRHGIVARTNGLIIDDGSLVNGALTITARGPVTGLQGDGIHAEHIGTAAMSIDALGPVRGGAIGIHANHSGAGSIRIITSDLVEGATSAISAQANGQPITITSSGLVRNASQRSMDLAVEAGGGPIAFANNGGMIGTVRFGAGAHTMVNNAMWDTAGGASEFGGGQLINAAGIAIVAAGNGGTAETTTFNSLGAFTNHGVLTMLDGGAGDITRQVGGNTRFAAGSALAVDIDAAGAADRFVTSGTADITGAPLAVSAQGVRVGRYTVVTADGGLTGTFGSVTGIGPISTFLGIIDTYDANNAYLDALRVRDFADAGVTPNQTSAAAGVQSLSGGNPFFAGSPLYDAILALPTDAAARNAFDQVSGEIHASVKTAMIEDSRFVRDAATNRVRAAFGAIAASRAPVMAYADPAEGRPDAYAAFASLDTRTAAATAVAPTTDRFALWGQGFGSWGHTNSGGNAARLNRSTGGFLIGGDAPVFDTWRLGMMAGYSRTSFTVRDRASSGGSDNYHLGLYGGTQWGNLGFRTGAAYTWHDISTSRSVVFPGFGDTLKGDYRAGTAQVFGELGYGIRAGSFGFEPFANLAYVNLSTDGFTERGGVAALRSASTSTGVTFTTLGLRASTDLSLGDTAATVRGMVGWRHAFSDTTPLSRFAFAGGSPFTIAGVPIAKGALVLDVGLDVAVTPNATLGVSYGGQFGGSAIDQSIKGNLAVRF